MLNSRVAAWVIGLLLLLSPVSARADSSSGETIKQVTAGQDVVLTSFWTASSPRVYYIASIRASANPLDKAVALARCDSSNCYAAQRGLTAFERNEDESLSIGFNDNEHVITLQLTPDDASTLGAGSHQVGYVSGSPNYLFEETRRYVFGSFSWNNFAESQLMQSTGTINSDPIYSNPFNVYSRGVIGTTTLGWYLTG